MPDQNRQSAGFIAGKSSMGIPLSPSQSYAKEYRVGSHRTHLNVVQEPIDLKIRQETEKSKQSISPSLPESPFLPQMSPAKPTGSRSFLWKRSAFSLQHYMTMNNYYRSVQDDLKVIVGTNKNIPFPIRNEWYAASQRTMLQGVAHTLKETDNHEQSYNYILSNESVDRFPRIYPETHEKVNVLI